MAGKTLTLVAVVLCLLLSACSSPSTDAPSTPPTPSAATATDSSVETSLERESRLDEKAAVKAYRIAVAEAGRLGVEGGTKRPSQLLESAATGHYLKFVLADLQQAKKNGWRLSGYPKIAFVSSRATNATLVNVKACEDYSKVDVLDRKGRIRTPSGSRRYVQQYSVVKVSKVWKVASVDSKTVALFNASVCHP